MLVRILTALMVIVLIWQVRLNHLQSSAIASMIKSDIEATRNQKESLDYITALHQVLDTHLEEGCISKPTEDALLKQMDLIVNVARRKGWWIGGTAVHLLGDE